MSKKKIILIGIPIGILILFVIAPISYQQYLKAYVPEEYAKMEAQWEIDRAKAKQDEMLAKQQEILDRQAKVEQSAIEEKQEKTRIGECFDINWKQHTQTIYKTMTESQYCSEFRDQLKLACSQEAKEWWTDMIELWC